MNYNRAALIDQLAAQYALGTLRGPARRRFERLCHVDAAAARALYQWEDWLIGLTQSITPVRPSPSVWHGVQQRVRQQVLPL